MKQTPKTILLPGLNRQFEEFRKAYSLKDASVLVVGSASPVLLELIASELPAKTDVIIDNEEQLMFERMNVPRQKNLRIKFMDYKLTDYADNTFDYVYAQGTVTLPHHKKITGELFRILKSGGTACIGETAYTKPDVPVSVNSVWEDAGMEPLHYDKLLPAYAESGFELAGTFDMSDTLEVLYRTYSGMISGRKKNDEELSPAEKHEMIRYRHETNMFIKMGGDKYCGYFVFMLRKP